MMPTWRLLLLLAVSLIVTAAQEQAYTNHKYQPKASNGLITYAANTSGTFQVSTLACSTMELLLSPHQLLTISMSYGTELPNESSTSACHVYSTCVSVLNLATNPHLV
jgi:hypothetical protein